MMANFGYTLENYRRLICRFKEEGYTFGPYDGELSQDKLVLLRHDIDYTLAYAVEFARINAEMGIAGTFFIQSRCRLYNLLDFDVQRAITEIADLGQYFGFHAVVGTMFDSLDSLRQFIAEEYELFSRLVPKTAPVFAWHNPGILADEGFDYIKADIPGLLNVYSTFGPDPIPYFADSNMRYTFDELCDLARQGHQVMQLAIAPMQWCPEAENMHEVMVTNLKRKVSDLEAGFSENYIYSDMFPEGLPQAVYDEFGRLCLDRAVGTREKVQ